MQKWNCHLIYLFSMWYIMKNHQTGWEGEKRVYEYVFYDTEKKTKTTVKGTPDTTKRLISFSKTIESISPSIAHRKRLYEYSSVKPSEFI